ncbi:MAG: hypothetical protein Q9168_002670 [Polycauliona sp. 1 TL-2023]
MSMAEPGPSRYDLRMRAITQEFSQMTVKYKRLYSKLMAGPDPKQNAEKWIDEWVDMYSLAKYYNMAEVITISRCFRDLYRAIYSYAPLVAHPYLRSHILGKMVIDEDAVFEMVRDFRSYLVFNKADNYTAAPMQADKSPYKRPPQNKAKKIPQCLCGEMEWYSECDYLYRDRPGRPANFKSDPAVKKIVEKKMEDPTVRRNVEKAIKKAKEWEAKKNEKVRLQ